MTRPADQRGADRRAPSTFGAEVGYDQPDAPVKPRTQHKPLRVVPDHGCHGYEAHGGMFTRCERHRPAASLDLGEVPGNCVECDMEPFTTANEKMEY